MGMGSRYHERASSIRSLITSFSDCLPVSFIRCSSHRLVSSGKRVLMLESSIVRGVRAMSYCLLDPEPKMKHTWTFRNGGVPHRVPSRVPRRLPRRVSVKRGTWRGTLEGTRRGRQNRVSAESALPRPPLLRLTARVFAHLA